MGKVSISRFIAAPPKRVFEIAADFEHAPKRITAIKNVEMLTGGEVKKGTRFRETRTMFGRETTEELEVTAYDPPRSYQVGCNSCGCWMETRFRFEPDGTGTNLVMDLAWKPLTLFAKLMSPLSVIMLKKCVAAFNQDIDELKYAAEQPIEK